VLGGRELLGVALTDSQPSSLVTSRTRPCRTG
jgi:hypothetical protein